MTSTTEPDDGAVPLTSEFNAEDAGPGSDGDRWPAPQRVLEAGIDFDNANAARMYDYFLGGAHNFAVDREMGERVVAANPDVIAWAQGNRAFLTQVVRYCAEQGVRQFLDLGSGIPTVSPVHEVARSVIPEARVAYVDFEPVAVAHSRDLLAGVEGVTITRADIRDPASVLSASTVTEVLDFSEPVAVLLVAAAHFLSEGDDPAGVLAAYRGALVPGSYLALTHGSTDYDDPALVEQFRRAVEIYRNSATPVQLRSREVIRGFFGDFELVGPGLVDIAHWSFDGTGDESAPCLGTYGAIGALRARE
jgi:hypothetical protein